MLNSSAGPSLRPDRGQPLRPLRRASAPWYGLSVTIPSVMLMTIGGNECGKRLGPVVARAAPTRCDRLAHRGAVARAPARSTPVAARCGRHRVDRRAPRGPRSGCPPARAAARSRGRPARRAARTRRPPRRCSGTGRSRRCRCRSSCATAAPAPSVDLTHSSSRILLTARAAPWARVMPESAQCRLHRVRPVDEEDDATRGAPRERLLVHRDSEGCGVGWLLNA